MNSTVRRLFEVLNHNLKRAGKAKNLVAEDLPLFLYTRQSLAAGNNHLFLLPKPDKTCRSDMTNRIVATAFNPRYFCVAFPTGRGQPTGLIFRRLNEFSFGRKLVEFSDGYEVVRWKFELRKYEPDIGGIVCSIRHGSKCSSDHGSRYGPKQRFRIRRNVGC